MSQFFLWLLHLLDDSEQPSDLHGPGRRFFRGKPASTRLGVGLLLGPFRRHVIRGLHVLFVMALTVIDDLGDDLAEQEFLMRDDFFVALEQNIELSQRQSVEFVVGKSEVDSGDGPVSFPELSVGESFSSVSRTMSNGILFFSGKLRLMALMRK